MYRDSELEFGLDIEWRAYVPGIYADTLQLVHLGRATAKPLGAFIPLTKVGTITARLAAPLKKSVLGGEYTFAGEKSHIQNLSVLT